MSWLSRLSELHVKCATMFDKIGRLSDSVEGLTDDLHDVSIRVGRVEGAIVNSSTPEILRQLADIQARISAIETSLALANGSVRKTPIALSKRRSALQLPSKAPAAGEP